jgi:positive regulator of sigma E activity
VRRLAVMNDFRLLSPVALQWLFPLILLVLVIAIAFAPSWLTGLVGAVVIFTLGYGGVTLYYRRSQQRDERNGLK